MDPDPGSPKTCGSGGSGFGSGSATLNSCDRKMENLSRGPTFGDFVTILTEGSMQDIHSCKTTEYKSTDFPLPPLFNVMYCVRVSLRIVKIFVEQH